jgi:predicted N-acetyltransferase YhbS
MEHAAQNPGSDLAMRAVRDERDAVRYIALSATINGEQEGVMCARLVRHHPATTGDDFVFVEDRATRAIVSTTCLIPWQMSLAGVTLDAAMLEMVVTHPAYRRRGLVRRQVQRFHERVTERGFDLSIIQGIPHYYRQFGYAYVLDHQPKDSLPAWRIPDQHAERDRYRLRAATVADVPALTTLYDAAMQWQGVCTLRAPTYWQFLLQHCDYPLRVVEDAAAGRAVGYLFSLPLPGGRGLNVFESAFSSHTVALAVLQLLKAEAPAELQLGGSAATTLVAAGRSLGSAPLPGDQWLLRIRDVAALLVKLGPLFERRLAESNCAGFTADLIVNLYREAFVLRFVGGRLQAVERAGFVDASMGADGGDLCVPPDAFVRLLFGYRTLAELRDAWPDTLARPGSRHVLDVLFPRLTSCVCMPY